MSLKTSEALFSKKAQGVTLRKHKVTIEKSKFDTDVAKIKELLAYGLSIWKRAINDLNDIIKLILES